MPLPIIQYVSSTYCDKPTDDQLMAKLLLNLTDFINFAAYIHHKVLVDGQSDMVDLVVLAVQLEARLTAWEHSVMGKRTWRFECKVATLSLDACYKGRFHLYSDVQTARIWSYYRWARILLSEILLNFIKQCPQSVATGLARLKIGNGGAAMQSSKPKTEGTDTTNPTETFRLEALRTIRRCAEETFINNPTFWRHPCIKLSEHAEVASPLPVYGVNGGMGVAGLVPTLFHLQVAACAPGILREDLQWALSVIDTVWGYLGLGQALSLANKMRAHDERLQMQSRGLASTDDSWPSHGK
ncbi:c6 zinc finger domain containing protein [Niveomyces insectorum RCEF 264]|uniref:C6 zinc finger domain containing protein n=1 Tax=Niveomyces insectorum RCEF 264 TaxID=1081102 RepID=A0A162JCP2_9HYPO|nr:c6 zinc finger domain containing protein [Niveomyces insectorum RCEF 264]